VYTDKPLPQLARQPGVVPAPVVHAWTIVLIAAGVLVTANVLAAIPAVSAARARPGRLLRTE
jgi:hypothetical protein